MTYLFFLVGEKSEKFHGPELKEHNNDAVKLCWIVGSVALVFAVVMTTILKLLLEPFHTNTVGAKKVAVSPAVNQDDTHGLDGKPSVEEEKEIISNLAIEEIND